MMNNPRNPNLPKPPPKAPPPRQPAQRPAAPPPAAPQIAARAPQVPAAPQPRLPAAPGRAPAPGTPARQAIRSEQIRVAIPGLPPTIDQMMEAVEIYDQLLAEENACLKAGDSSGVAGLLDRKVAATRLYQERLQAVLSQKAQDRSMKPEMKARVVAMIKAMEQRAHENTVLLKANMQAIEQVIESVHSAAREQRQRESGYSVSGQIRESHSAVGASMAFNRTV